MTQIIRCLVFAWDYKVSIEMENQRLAIYSMPFHIIFFIINKYYKNYFITPKSRSLFYGIVINKKSSIKKISYYFIFDKQFYYFVFYHIYFFFILLFYILVSFRDNINFKSHMIPLHFPKNELLNTRMDSYSKIGRCHTKLVS